jgi:lysophospholipase L1-like esterase
MKMNEEILIDGYKGCLQVERTNEGLKPLRFSSKQLEYYSKVEVYRIRSLCPAGVSLDFITSSAYVRIRYTIKSLVRKWAYFDVYVNDVFSASLGSAVASKGEGEFNLDIPLSNQLFNRITIYFPHNVEMTVNDFEVSDHSEFKPIVDNSKKLLCIGDSITQGMNALNPSSTYPVMLARSLKMNLLNQGIGGHVFDAKSLDSGMSYDPDVITVAYGTNDWTSCTSLSQFRSKCAEFFEYLVNFFPDSKIFAITPIWRTNWLEKRRTGTFREIGEAISEICEEHYKISVIDGMELIPNHSRYFNDEVHPTNEGFKHMSINLSKNLKS